MTGRPSDFTVEIAAAICDQVSDGKSLREICSADGMPHRATVFRWLEANSIFRDQYARAKAFLADMDADDIVDIADGRFAVALDGEEEAPADPVRDRLRVDARRRAARGHRGAPPLGQGRRRAELGGRGQPAAVGTYWHMLPEASQARKAIWDAVNPHTGKRRIDEAFPKESGAPGPATTTCSSASATARRGRWWAPTTSTAWSARRRSASSSPSGRSPSRTPGPTSARSWPRTAAGRSSSGRRAAGTTPPGLRGPRAGQGQLVHPALHGHCRPASSRRAAGPRTPGADRRGRLRGRGRRQVPPGVPGRLRRGRAGLLLRPQIKKATDEGRIGAFGHVPACRSTPPGTSASTTTPPSGSSRTTASGSG
jgi:hypothetical protein